MTSWCIYTGYRVHHSKDILSCRLSVLKTEVCLRRIIVATVHSCIWKTYFGSCHVKRKIYTHWSLVLWAYGYLNLNIKCKDVLADIILWINRCMFGIGYLHGNCVLDLNYAKTNKSIHIGCVNTYNVWLYDDVMIRRDVYMCKGTNLLCDVLIKRSKH